MNSMITGKEKLNLNKMENNIPYPKKVLKPCPDIFCNLRLICKRPKANLTLIPYANIWHGEDEETGIHFCNYIIHSNEEDKTAD